MAKFKIGDKVIGNLQPNGRGNLYLHRSLTQNKIYCIEKVEGSLVVVTADDGVSSYWSEDWFKLYEEKETEMNAEQIRDEILRIDARIEEAKKDIENAEKERNSLVEKLREKGFEIVKPPSFKGRLNVGDKVKVIDNTTSHQFPIGAEVRIKFVHDNYYDCVNLEGVQWCCYDRDVEKI